MSAAFIDKLYEPFEQENAEVMPIYEGSGLGSWPSLRAWSRWWREQNWSEEQRGWARVYCLSGFWNWWIWVETGCQHGKMTSIKGHAILTVEDHPLNASNYRVKFWRKTGLCCRSCQGWRRKIRDGLPWPKPMAVCPEGKKRGIIIRFLELYCPISKRQNAEGEFGNRGRDLYRTPELWRYLIHTLSWWPYRAFRQGD